MIISESMKKRLAALATEDERRPRQKNEIAFYMQMPGELHARLKRAARIWRSASMAEFTRQAIEQFCTAIEESCGLPSLAEKKKEKNAALRIPLSKLRG